MEAIREIVISILKECLFIIIWDTTDYHSFPKESAKLMLAPSPEAAINSWG